MRFLHSAPLTLEWVRRAQTRCVRGRTDLRRTVARTARSVRGDLVRGQRYIGNAKFGSLGASECHLSEVYPGDLTLLARVDLFARELKGPAAGTPRSGT